MEAIARIHLADDGSEHAAWMLHYALRMARHLDPAKVQILHVREPQEGDMRARQRHHAVVAERYGVELVAHEIDAEGDVAATLASHVQAGRQDVVMVGFRAHRHGRGLAFGTVGHALLARHDHSVLAMRIVQPGNMGLPGAVAMGLSGSPGAARRLRPVLRLLAPDLEDLFLLRVMEVQRRFLGLMTFPQTQKLEGEGLAALGEAAVLLREGLGDAMPRADLRVSITDRWPSQLVMDAHRVHAHLLLLGASDHLLPRRFAPANPLETVLRNAACDVAVFRVASS